jgi:hypothetical protein
MSVQNLFSPGQHPKSHRRLYFQQVAVKKGIKMFSQLPAPRHKKTTLGNQQLYIIGNIYKKSSYLIT